MIHYRRLAMILVVALIIAMMPIAVFSANKTSKTDVEAKDVSGLSVDAKSAVLIDAGSGTVMFEQNSHEKLPPASVTKVMTMLLVLEAVDRGQISLNDKVTISEKAASMGGSQMYMEPGEQHELNTLMQGIAICSANDEQ